MVQNLTQNSTRSLTDHHKNLVDNTKKKQPSPQPHTQTYLIKNHIGCTESTMANHTSKLETRTELQARVSVIHGRSEFDRQDSIAHLLVQLQKDLAAQRRFREDVISRLKNLKGIDNIRGTKSVIRDLNDDIWATHLLETGCLTILDLTKNKNITVAAEKRYSVREAEQKYFEKAEKFALEKERNPDTKLCFPSKSEKIDVKEEYNEMVERRRLVKLPDEVLSPAKNKKKRINTITPPSTKRMPAKRKSNRKRKQYSSESRIGNVSLKIKDKEHVLPEPGKHEKIYTLREIILHMEPFKGKGVKKMAKRLREEGRVLVSPTTLLRYIKNYEKNPKSLPADDDFGVKKKGRPSKIVDDKVSEKLNAREHANISYVGDGLQEAKEALIEATKEAAKAKGICVDSVSIEPDPKTVEIYDRMATFYGF
jgi:hypothetical protein